MVTSLLGGEIQVQLQLISEHPRLVGGQHGVQVLLL
jgi:hypothetical protein